MAMQIFSISEPSAMRKLVNCFNSRLVKIYASAAQIEAVDKKVNMHLDNDLQAHCKVRSFDQGCITIEVDSAWASRLRYALPQLRNQLRIKERLYSLRSIKLKTRQVVNHHKIKPKVTPKIRCGEQSYTSLHQAAKAQDHQGLKSALENLAETMRQRSTNK